MAITPSTRAYSCDLALFGYTQIGGSLVNLLGLYKNCSLRTNFELVDAYAPRDILPPGAPTNALVGSGNTYGYKLGQVKKKKWSVDLGLFVDGSSNNLELFKAAFALDTTIVEASRGIVHVQLGRPAQAASGAPPLTGGYLGATIIENVKYKLTKDGPIMQSGTLAGWGPLTIG